MKVREFFRAQPLSLGMAVVLFMALAWCGFLVTGRILFTASFAYGFLLWNLTLSVLPLVFSSLLYLKTAPVWRAGLGLFWLLFLPNAPYIITDLVHLPHIRGAPLWFDTLMISSCAGTGLAFGYASIMQVHVLLLRTRFRIAGRIFLLSSFFLVGFGIYLGRFQRWNSMDLFQSPLLLMIDVTDRILNPISHPRTWGFTIGFGVLLALGYALLLTFSRAAHGQSEPDHPSAAR